MVRATVAFAVVALGAAAVIAQSSEGTSQLEARDFNNDLELREYVLDDLEARDDLEDIIDIDAREPEPEFFDDIEAREYEAEELEARDFEDELEARAPPQDPLNEAPGDPSKTVTITATPTPTSCTKKELKSQKEETKVKKARAVLRSAKGKQDLSRKEKQQVKKARKYLRRVQRRRVRAAKRTAKKCRSALRKGGKSASSAKCTAASKYLQRVKASKKSKKGAKKNLDKSKVSKSGQKHRNLLAASKTTVGEDGVTTVTVNAGPTCTPASGSSSRLKRKLVARDIVDEEFDSMFAREYEFDNLD
jgi:hypothetical protein